MIIRAVTSRVCVRLEAMHGEVLKLRVALLKTNRAYCSERRVFTTGSPQNHTLIEEILPLYMVLPQTLPSFSTSTMHSFKSYCQQAMFFYLSFCHTFHLHPAHLDISVRTVSNVKLRRPLCWLWDHSPSCIFNKSSLNVN